METVLETKKQICPSYACEHRILFLQRQSVPHEWSCKLETGGIGFSREFVVVAGLILD